MDEIVTLPDPELKFDCSKWNTKINAAVTARTNFEQQWYTNLAFYRGKQWVVWQSSSITTSGVALTTPKTSRKRLVFNRIMPTVRREYTKLTKEEPVAFVQPATTDQGDIAASKTGEAIAEYLAVSSKFNAARRRSVWWATQCGTGFLKTSYDGNKTLKIGKPVGDSKEPSDIDGTVDYTGVSPFHVLVPYLELEEIEEQPWVAHVRTYSPEAVKDSYGVEVEPTSEVSTSNTETRFRNAINIKQTNTAKQVLVSEVWIKPCKDYPEGLLAVWAGEKKLLITKYPYNHGEFPFQKITHIPSGGFYGISTTEGLIPMQKEYNLMKSQMAEARDLTSKPALVATRGSVDIKKLKAIPGQVIEYMPGTDPPRRLINPDMPTYVMDMVEDIKRDMDDNSAQYEITKGRTPPGVEAASAIAYLQEENDTMLYHTVASLELAVQDSGRQSLSLIQQYWSQSRIINTISKTHLQGAIEFKGSDLKGNFDLRVVADSMAPRSRAAKQASVLEFIKLGIVPPAVGLKHFAMSETDAMYEEIHVDVNQAKRENLRMARSEAVEPNAWDNHIIHVQEHEQYMKSQEFELLEDQAKQIFIEHVQRHKTIEVAENVTNAGEPVATGPGPNADPTIPGEQPTGGDI